MQISHQKSGWKKFWKCDLSMENDENMCASEDDSCVKDHEGLDDVLIKN